MPTPRPLTGNEKHEVLKYIKIAWFFCVTVGRASKWGEPIDIDQAEEQAKEFSKRVEKML